LDASRVEQQPFIETHQSVQAHEPGEGLDLRKLAMWVFLSSEVIFFGSLIATFLVYKGRSIGEPGHEVLNVPLTGVNTFVLIISSLTMVLSLDAAIHDRQRQLKFWLLATIALGTVFLGIQGYEYFKLWEEGLTPTANLFGSAFYPLTGFHGTHVLIGVIILWGVLVKALFGGFGPKHYLPIELAGLYWHFVDLVWIVIFTLIYLLK
jgi:cytochrome c oxidase subunit 3/cytochrome o ubiquinol oxidase subunit 3